MAINIAEIIKEPLSLLPIQILAIVAATAILLGVPIGVIVRKALNKIK